MNDPTGDPAPSRQRWEPHPIEIAGIRPPDSKAAQAAERLCREASSWLLYAHSVRSYVYASLLASSDGRQVNDEALYVGCILHDIGLTPRYEQPTQPFEEVSAAVATSLMAEQGWEDMRRAALGRAIVLHMAAEIGSSELPESHALEAGVALDVTGRRLADLDHAVVAEVLRVLPRGPFKRDFTALIEREAERKPRSATALGTRRGLLDRIGTAPFDDTP
jgi:HD superfamily phosphodiesterase